MIDFWMCKEFMIIGVDSGRLWGYVRGRRVYSFYCGDSGVFFLFRRNSFSRVVGCVCGGSFNI